MNKTDIAPQNKNISFELTKLKKDGQIKKAIEFCQQAISEDPTNSELHINLGDLYLQRHLDIYQAKQCVDDAITEYQRALESNMNSGLIHYKIGVALFHKGELDKAISHFDMAIDYDEKMANAYFMKARSLSKKDRLVEAIENAKIAIKYGNLKTARAHYLIYNLINIGFKKNFKMSLKSFGHFLLAGLKLPFDPSAIAECAKRIGYLQFFPIIFKGYYLEKSKNIEKAIELYNENIEKVPGFLPLYIVLGDAYKNLGKYEEAANEYKMVLWHDPLNISAYKALCQLYEEQGDYDKAVNCYKTLISIHPKNPVLYSNLANILYLKGDVKEAIKYYHSAITLNPNKTWTSVVAQTLGYVFQESAENYDAAISAYQSAYLMNPNDTDIYISLGSVFYDKGDYDNAASVYRIALDIEPHNARIHCNLAFLLWGRGKINEAIKEYELAIKYDPDYDIALNNLGVIYLDDLGRVKNAEDLFERAIKCNPNYALAYYNLARALALRGDKIEAARLYQIALDLNSVTNELDSAEIKERINNLFD